VRRPLTSSFPSGHATAGFSAAMMLSEGDELAPLYFALAAVVATSRIYVKIHHASDVAGGVALGLVLGAIGRRLAPSPR
jgi:undecaprenyl-diphosphatase